MNAPSTPPLPAAVRPFRASWGARLLALALIAYSIYALGQLDFSAERFIKGIDNGARFLARMFPPNFKDWPQLLTGLVESLQIAVLATFFGVLISLPIAILGARNLMPAWVTWPARFIVTFCRAFNPVIVAIIFIKAVGFGPLAGILALIVASVGFVGKLLGEALEEVPRGPIEALKAAGATQSSQILYGYWPAVKPAFWSIMLLRWDINVRESSVLGLVGAGGIGMIMNSAIDLFEWDRVAIILLTIFAVVVIAEIVITYFRRRLL